MDLKEWTKRNEKDMEDFSNIKSITISIICQFFSTVLSCPKGVFLLQTRLFQHASLYKHET